MGGVNFQSPSKKWRATRLAASLASQTLYPTEDDCSGRSIERILMELSVLITERPDLARKGGRRLSCLWEKPFQDQDLVASLTEGSLGLLRINYWNKIT